MKHSLTNFKGMFPRYQPYLIPDTASQLVVDGNVVSGGLEALRQDRPVLKLSTLPKDFYKYVSKKGAQWLYFDSPVDLCRTAVIDDVTNQMFITGVDSELRTFDSNTVALTDTTIDTTNSYKAGISAPATPTLSKVTSGSSSTKETFSYLIAYARYWDDSEKIDLGPASNPARTSDNKTYIDVDAGKQAVISGIKKNPDTDEHCDRVYIYRSSTTSSGTGQWRYVLDFSTTGGAVPQGVTYDAASQSYTFTDYFEEEDLGEIPENLDWSCPSGLKGIISLRNGVLAGFKDNTVYLSVAYQGHAWPTEYAIPLDFQIVGLGGFGNTLVICTEANTFMVVVNDPAATILIPLQEAKACVSKASIVSMSNAVLYATRYGIISVTSNGAKLVTGSFITEKEWQYYKPETIVAAPYQDKYVFFFDSDVVDYNGGLIDFSETTTTGILGMSQRVSAIFADDSSSSVYITYIHPVLLVPEIFALCESKAFKRIYRWRSKKFLNNDGLFTLSAGKINFYNDQTYLKTREYSALPSSNAFNSTVVNQFSIDGDASTNDKNIYDFTQEWCSIDLYVDDSIRKTLNVYTNVPFRLPAGFRGDSFYVDITSTEPIARVQLASSIGELE